MRPVIVVIGANPEPAVTRLTGLPVILALNRDWAEGLNSYLRVAVLTALAESNVAALALWRSDQVNVSAEDLARLLGTPDEQQGNVVAASLGDRTDLPAVFSRDYFRELLTLGTRDGLSIGLTRGTSCSAGWKCPARSNSGGKRRRRGEAV